MYVVILAGGGGTRLWPLSRRDRPKPFLPLIGAQTLFERTVARVRPLVGMEGIYVVAERRHVPHVLAQAPDLAPGHVLAEPEGRNTAAAIALAALAIERPSGEVMVVLPADAWIADDAAFREILLGAAGPGGIAEGVPGLGVDAPLVTLGVQPDPERPQPGYGHLLADPAAPIEVPVPGTGRLVAAYRLAAFVEKPDPERAARLAGQAGVAWNAGMFAWQRRAIQGALERFAGDILHRVRLALAAPRRADAGPFGESEAGPLGGAEAARRYAQVRAISIDYAVLEPAAAAGAVVMASMPIGWSDVGSWSAVRDLQRAAQSATRGGEAPAPRVAGEPLDFGSHDLLVRSLGGRLVATVGLSDTIVVDTPDALLVCAADRAQDVRAIVERLREAGETEHL
ncbi:MAG: mannose-1-phosphate guanylyltransferase [Candidatus Limnocylindrales bacterium]